MTLSTTPPPALRPAIDLGAGAAPSKPLDPVKVFQRAAEMALEETTKQRAQLVAQRAELDTRLETLDREHKALERGLAAYRRAVGAPPAGPVGRPKPAPPVNDHPWAALSPQERVHAYAREHDGIVVMGAMAEVVLDLGLHKSLKSATTTVRNAIFAMLRAGELRTTPEGAYRLIEMGAA